MTFINTQSYGSPHHLFLQLAGSWMGTSSTWLEPESLPDIAQTQGSIQLLLDGRFAIYLYQSALQGEPQHGMFTFGYNLGLERFEASWIDSFHNNTAIMYCTGEPIDKGFWVLGSYPDPSGGPDWGWRTEVRLRDHGHLTITAYNITPEGNEMKAIESKLTRLP